MKITRHHWVPLLQNYLQITDTDPWMRAPTVEARCLPTAAVHLSVEAIRDSVFVDQGFICDGRSTLRTSQWCFIEIIINVIDNWTGKTWFHSHRERWPSRRKLVKVKVSKLIPFSPVIRRAWGESFCPNLSQSVSCYLCCLCCLRLVLAYFSKFTNTAIQVIQYVVLGRKYLVLGASFGFSGSREGKGLFQLNNTFRGVW